MSKGVIVVLTNAATSEQEQAFNDWYDHVHVPDLLKVPGVSGARRFRVASAQATEDAEHSDHVYLAIYELDGDLEVVADEIPRRAADGTFTMTDAISTNPPPRAVVYEEIQSTDATGL